MQSEEQPNIENRKPLSKSFWGPYEFHPQVRSKLTELGIAVPEDQQKLPFEKVRLLENRQTVT